MTSPTLMGHVGAVSGATVSIRQFEGVKSGISIIGGRTYRVGQVGSFIRIPQGYHSLYGVISDVGATANPESQVSIEGRGFTWMKAQLVGEVVEVAFERGISQYPSIDDEVHLVTEDDLARIYGREDIGQIVIGRLAGAESVSVRVDLDRLVSRHSAILGSTGSGKSTTVASLLRSIAGIGASTPAFPRARILVLDIHGEYSRAFSGVSKVFRTSPRQGEFPLRIPFWALEASDLLPFLFGKLEDKAATAILDRIQFAKLELAKRKTLSGVAAESMTADSPIPFSLKTLWAELVDPEYKTWSDAAKTVPALVSSVDARTLAEPVYKPASLGSAAPFLNTTGVLSIRRQLSHLRSRLLDHQYDFMLAPGDWEPDLDGSTKRDLSDLLHEWLGHDKPITVLDLSGIPPGVLNRLVGGILNIVYQALFWGRERPEGGRQRPELVVMEEAHRYLGKEADNPARTMVQRIVKEGRKFGVGAMLVSQRPSEIDDTILSQCGTMIALRLTNTSDRQAVQAVLPDSLSGLVDSLWS